MAIIVGTFSMNSKKITNIINYFLWTILFVVIVQFAIKDFKIIQDGRPIYIIKNFSLDYDSKMKFKIGKLPYEYTMFIKNNTPENATILIPPQAYPWNKTSNAAYLRYFLYPRKLINGNEKDTKVDLNIIDYVLVDYGETNVSQYGYTNVWPKFNVKGKYVIYWDPLTNKSVTDVSGVYKYNANDKDEIWGIIKL